MSNLNYNRIYYYWLFHLDTVSGCIDPDLPVGVWMDRDENVAHVGCSPKDKEENENVQKWKCVDEQWVGDLPNCEPTEKPKGVCKMYYWININYLQYLKPVCGMWIQT